MVYNAACGQDLENYPVFKEVRIISNVGSNLLRQILPGGF